MLNLLAHAYGYRRGPSVHPIRIAAGAAGDDDGGGLAGHCSAAGCHFNMLLSGTAGLAVIALDQWLRRRAPASAPLLAVAVGIYLPMGSTLPVVIGWLLVSYCARRARTPRIALCQPWRADCRRPDRRRELVRVVLDAGHLRSRAACWRCRRR